MPRFSRLCPALTLLALLLTAACNSPQAVGTATSTVISADPLVPLTYEGNQSALVALDRDLAAAGQDPQKLAAISARLLTLLRTPAATGAARQAAAQRLGTLPTAALSTPDATALFLALAADERQINFVKLALDHAPGAAVDEIFLRALAAAAPADRLAWVQSIGNRRIATAVPKLAPLLGDADLALAATTAKALGQIGTADALAALKNSVAPTSPTVAEARLAAAHALGGAAALAEFQSLLDAPAAPANLRAAALHGLLFAEPDTAPDRLAAVLRTSDAVTKPVALEAIAKLPSPTLVATLAAALPSFDAATQVAVIAAFGRRGDAAAVPAVSECVRSPDAAVRSAALTALGQLPGTPAVVELLARVAAGANADDAKLARQSLARLDGTGVADAVIAGATAGDVSLRVVLLDALASRNMTASVPLLLQTRADANAAIRSAALGALADLASFDSQAAILDWTLAATDAAEQSRALRALAAISLRGADAATRALPVIAAIDRAAPEVALRLLPVLPRIGGPAAAECAGRLALRDDARLAAAATTTLARWTDGDGLSPLIVVAEKATLPGVRASAADGAFRYLQRSRELSSAALRAAIIRLLAATEAPATRRELVYLLSRSSDADALATLATFQSDPALAATAADATQVIRSNLAGRPAVVTSANPEQAPNLIDGKMRSSWNVTAEAGRTIQLDFHSSRPFHQVVVDGGRNQYNYPEHLELFVTDDPAQPGAALVSVAGHLGKNVLDLPAGTHGRYVIIRHSQERPDSWWTVAELTWD